METKMSFLELPSQTSGHLQLGYFEAFVLKAAAGSRLCVAVCC